jgi:hypothetical protein
LTSVAERRGAAESIGQTFERIGVQSVGLLDRSPRLEVSYRHGVVFELAPHPADSGTRETSN